MRLVIDGVSKLYKGKVWGLRDFNLELEAGVLALVGPNGAGKTTTLRVMLDVFKPDRGTVSILGGLMTEEIMLKGQYTVF